MCDRLAHAGHLLCPSLQGSWQAWQGTVFTNAKAGMQSVDAAKVKQVCLALRRHTDYKFTCPHALAPASFMLL